MTQREIHYCPELRETQYWECLPGGNFDQVDHDVGEDWPIESYRYIAWAREIPPPLTKKGLPPRALW